MSEEINEHRSLVLSQGECDEHDQHRPVRASIRGRLLHTEASHNQGAPTEGRPYRFIKFTLTDCRFTVVRQLRRRLKPEAMIESKRDISSK